MRKALLAALVEGYPESTTSLREMWIEHNSIEPGSLSQRGDAVKSETELKMVDSLIDTHRRYLEELEGLKEDWLKKRQDDE